MLVCRRKLQKIALRLLYEPAADPRLIRAAARC